jgi:rhodanese-related sulfurtransferase
MQHINVEDLAPLLAAQSVVLLDVRQPEELLTAKIDYPQLLNIPLNQLPQRLHEVPTDQPLMVLCHHGMRSQNATHYLLNQGFAHAVNVAGGIEQWSVRIDASVPRY